MGSLLILFHPRVLQSPYWRATVTPLASIIGSGFLVLGPLLVNQFGGNAIWVMGGLCLTAWLIGSAIRFNMLQYAQLQGSEVRPLVSRLENIASWSLAVAYVISVTFYLNLFGAFATKLLPVDSIIFSKIISTVVLASVGLIGYAFGLSALERLEELSVGIKLAIISGFLIGLVAFAVEKPQLDFHLTQWEGINIHGIAVAFGLIITIQGFETSRYLMDEYDVETGVKTMKFAQIVASSVYMIYIVLAVADFAGSEFETTETAIIDMTRTVSPILPGLLVVAALSAQFSAAVADTSGSGGLTQELTGKRISTQKAYLILAMVAIVITWTANIFEIISLASRAFAVYYFLQCTISVAFVCAEPRLQWFRLVYFCMLATLTFCIAVFGIPAPV